MNDNIHGEFDTLLNEWVQAIISNDAEGIGQFMADDWVIVGETGVTARSDFLALIESGDLTHEAMELNVVRVRVYDDVAVVISQGTNRGTFKGEFFNADEWTTDVFVKQDGPWQCVLTQLTPVKA